MTYVPSDLHLFDKIALWKVTILLLQDLTFLGIYSWKNNAVKVALIKLEVSMNSFHGRKRKIAALLLLGQCKILYSAVRRSNECSLWDSEIFSVYCSGPQYFFIMCCSKSSLFLHGILNTPGEWCFVLKTDSSLSTSLTHVIKCWQQGHREWPLGQSLSWVVDNQRSLGLDREAFHHHSLYLFYNKSVYLYHYYRVWHKHSRASKIVVWKLNAGSGMSSDFRNTDVFVNPLTLCQGLSPRESLTPSCE